MGEPPIVSVVIFEEDLILDQKIGGIVEIWNRSNHSAKVVGIERSCRCFSLDEESGSPTIREGKRVRLPLTQRTLIPPKLPYPRFVRQKLRCRLVFLYVQQFCHVLFGCWVNIAIGILP